MQHYEMIKKNYPQFTQAVESLGKESRECGPISEASGHLIQLAAAVAIRSEGAAHSHVRRALALGVSPAEIYHSLILLTSTIGFPSVMAGLSWAQDIIDPPT